MTDRSSPPDRRILAIWLPALAIDRWRLGEGLRRGEGADAQPFALLAETAHGPRIAAAGDINGSGDEEVAMIFTKRTPPMLIVRGAGSEQLIHFAQLHDIVSFESDVDASQGAFMDTAAMLANLDLIVTTDTAMAHLAGAMGRPAWVALPHTPEWRWQRHGATSPWYPSLRLFRQAAPGDWQGVFAHMAAELCNLVAG